ncbi:MAG TPA: hypothetical protein VIJ79_13910 [Acidobacteriaceae bacterium]
MYPRTLLVASSLVLAASPLALAQSVQTDPQAYCAYLTEQARAQSDLLRTPKGVAILTQPETGLPTQVAAGASLSLSDFKKSGLTLDAARKNCDLYQATVDVQQVLQYALPSIEKDALRHRLELIAQASTSLDALTDKTAKMVEAQNMTRPMLMEMQMNKIKLEADRADTQSRISAIYVPPLNPQSLKAQAAQKQARDVIEQQALAKVTKQSNWDVQLAVGAHQQVNPLANGVGPYGEVTASYSFASRAIDRHLDRAVDDYAIWKNVQMGDTASSMEVLRTQVAENIAAQEARLKSLQAESQQVEKNLQTVGDADTTAALDFRNQLAATKLLLDIEIGDTSFRIERLKNFLSSNY